MKRNNKKQLSLDDLAKEQLRLSEEMLKRAKEQSKVIDQMLSALERHAFSLPKEKSCPYVDRRLLSFTQPQSN